jgi:hypothetical protein
MLSTITSMNASMSASPALWGIATLAVNLGARFVTTELTPAQQEALRHPATKRCVLFCMVFLVTRNALVSLMLTVAAVVVLEGLANEHSPFNILFTRPVQLPMQHVFAQHGNVLSFTPGAK